MKLKINCPKCEGELGFAPAYKECLTCNKCGRGYKHPALSEIREYGYEDGCEATMKKIKAALKL